MMLNIVFCIFSLVAFGNLIPTLADYTFLGIGDWGGAYLSKYNEPNMPYYKKNVDSVAAQMDIVAKATDAKFIINTGDNFYWCGIQ